MIKIRTLVRRGSLVAVAAAFALSALFLNSRPAQMQTGSNTIVFERSDLATGTTKIFVTNADGSNVVELATGFDPAWSGDGTKIVYAAGYAETPDLWTMNADGTNQRQLTENFGSYAPAWSPDGTRIAFFGYFEGTDSIYIIGADGQNQHKLNITAPELTGVYAPAWSPDGTKIIFLGRKVVNGLDSYDYYQTDANNSGVTTRLTFVDALFGRDSAAISPDGTKMVLEYQNELQEFTLGPNQTITNLTAGSPLSVGYADYAPSGSKIVYTHGTTLTVMDADGTNKVNLDVVGRNADWNPTAVISVPTPTPTPTPTPAIAADLEVDAYASAINVSVGGQVTYTIEVDNLGPNNATGVAVGAAIPSTITTTSLQASQGSCSIANGQLDCQLGNIAANGQATITLTANMNTVGYVSTTFTGTAIETDPDAANNSQTVGVTVSGQCATPVTTPIEITRSQWRRYDNLGQDELILTIRNVSGQSLDPRLIFVFDNLPQGVSIDPSLVAGYTQCSTPQGSPYLVSYAPNKKEWKHMQTVSVRVLFNNPSRGGIPFQWRLYSGNVNP